ncbi:transposase [Lentzea sp. NEAU-D7]|uniref:transposase n=1 Tax=Lentzea sp. NEAU-D7 TaxID=2994667 RepID=UPI00224AB6C7|nr:transposase [Lentzea sp. NEAU-D7]MCX2955427.1 transposase [Lentzea sp. NEAU-D7]
MAADFPSWPTVCKRFTVWEKAGTARQLLDALRNRVRLASGRTAAPSTAIIDSQSVRAAPTVATAIRGFNAGKVQGRKRHIAVDTLGLLIAVLVTQHSHWTGSARVLLQRLCSAGGRVRPAWADGGYTGTLLGWVRSPLAPTVEIAKRPDPPHFTVLPRGGWWNAPWRGPPTTAAAPAIQTTTPPRGNGPMIDDQHHCRRLAQAQQLGNRHLVISSE